jgi:hypothetical protein
MNLPNIPKNLFSTTGALQVDGPLDLTDALGLMFVYLKLTVQIGWSWWWVTAPFWIKLIMLSIVSIISIVRLSKNKPGVDD